MTAHRPKPTITPERVDWFARYEMTAPCWGAFHVALDDGNYKCGAVLSGDEPDDVREAAAWFDSLTPSQRRRLRDKAERRAQEMRRKEAG